MQAIMPVLTDGIYGIVNAEFHNCVTLVNGNDQEDLRGVYPIKASSFRDTEQVSYSTLNHVSHLQLTYIRFTVGADPLRRQPIQY